MLAVLGSSLQMARELGGLYVVPLKQNHSILFHGLDVESGSLSIVKSSRLHPYRHRSVLSRQLPVLEAMSATFHTPSTC
jgi:hypothetical protein